MATRMSNSINYFCAAPKSGRRRSSKIRRVLRYTSVVCKRALVSLAGALLPLTVGLCMDITCRSCSDSCCQWAFAAQVAVVNGEPSIEVYSREVFERYGFDPVPCREVRDNERAYYRCAEKAFFECLNRNCCEFKTHSKRSFNLLKPEKALEPRFYESLNETLDKIRFNEEWQEHSDRGVGGSEQIRLHPGQVIILRKVNGRWEEIQEKHQ